ncbi:MAG TPA: hypothetical protein VJG32_23050 [Anaerolineae bacterium]|nr:hypothetical protein [Anaerolineae bacterium]
MFSSEVGFVGVEVDSAFESPAGSCLAGLLPVVAELDRFESVMYQPEPLN